MCGVRVSYAWLRAADETPCGLLGARADVRIVKRALRHPVESSHDPLSAQRNQLDLTGVAGLESHCGSRGDVQAHAIRLRPIERQPAIDFEKVAMRPDLDGAVALIADCQPACRSPAIDFDWVALEKVLAWNHAQLVCPNESADGR